MTLAQPSNPIRDSGAQGHYPYENSWLGRLDRKLFSGPAGRYALAAIIALLLIIPSAQLTLRKIQKTESSEARQREQHESALGRWLADAQALVDGGDPYGVGHWFPAPPLVLLGLVPFNLIFTTIGITATAFAWSLLKIAAVIGGCGLVLASARRSDFAVPLGVMVLAVLFSARPIWGDITHANINIFVFFEIALAWWLFVNHRDLMAGVIIGLAIVTKVTPGLLLVYFLYKRAWRVVLGAGVGLFLFAGLVPTLILGLERNLVLLDGWFSLIIRPYLFHGFVTLEAANQSLSGTLIRVLWYLKWMKVQMLTADLLPPGFAERFGTELYPMARPASLLGATLIRAVNLSIIAALAWLCRTPTTDRRNPRLLLELSLVLVAMLLLSERTWKHHLTTLPIIYLGVWLTLLCYPWPRRTMKILLAGLALQFILLVLLKSDLALAAGVITLGLLLCFVQTAVMLRRFQARSAEAPAALPAG